MNASPEGNEKTDVHATKPQFPEDTPRLTQPLGELISRVSPAPTLISIVSDGRILDVNSAFLQVFGYEREEVISRTTVEIGLWANSGHSAEAVAAYRQSGAIWKFEVELRTQSGKPLFASAASHSVEIDGYECFITTLLDITERRRIEQALRESEERFKSAFEFAAIGMALVAPDGRWVQVNRSLCEIVGYCEEELLSLDFQSLTHPDDLDSDLAHVQQLLRGEIRSYQMEKRYLHKQGHVVWVLLSVSIVRDSAGEPLYFISQIQDITARKEAKEKLRASEEALRQSEALLRVVFDLLPVGVIVVDAVGNIVSTNLAAREIWQGERHGSIERYGEYRGWWAETGEAIQPHDWALARAIGKGETSREEVIEIECFDGGRKTILNWALPLKNEQDEITGGIAVIQDITARRQAEEQILQLNQGLERRVEERTRELRTANELLRLAMEETQRAANAKSAFLSRASHELRTPLNVILGFAQLLEFEELPDTSRECVDHILISGQHLLQLINEILDVARIESGHLRAKAEAVNLAETVREMAQLTAALATRRDVSLRVDEGENPAWAMADRQLLKQVMLNLLSNAVKYNRPEGTIIVRWDRISPGWWRCVVQDTGPGIREEDMPRLFQPFERLDTSLSSAEGAGLGLMICQHFMRAMNGRIGVESEVGVGSRFWIELPDTEHSTSPSASREKEQTFDI